MSGIDSTDECRILFEKAKTLEGSGDYAGSIAAYTKLLEFDPDNARLYNNRGLVFANSGDLDRSIADYDRAIELDPDMDTAYYGRANCHLDRQDYGLALADIDKSLELCPDDAAAYNIRGLIYRQQDDLDQAITDFGKAIAATPEYAMAYSNRAGCYLRKEDYPRAIEDYEHARRLDPEDGDTVRWLATAYGYQGADLAEAGDVEAAIDVLKTGIEIESGIEMLHSLLGRALLVTGHAEDAISELREAIRIGPESAESQVILADALLKCGKHEEAIQHYETALKLGLHDILVYANLGNALSLSSDYESAAAAFREAVSLDPNDGRSHSDLGMALCRLGRNEEALKELEEAEKLGDPDVDVRVKLVRGLLEPKSLDANTTPLFLALAMNEWHIAESLIANGADVNGDQGGGASLLHIAIKAGLLPMVQFLLNCEGIDVEAGLENKNGTQRTPLLIAVTEEELQSETRKAIIETLLDSGADIQRDNGVGPIALSAMGGATAALEAMLPKWGDVNARNSHGLSLLHYAVTGGHKETVEFLLSIGADPDMHHPNGDSNIQLALGMSHIEIAALLKKRLGDTSGSPWVNDDETLHAMSVEELISRGDAIIDVCLDQSQSNPDFLSVPELYENVEAGLCYLMRASLRDSSPSNQAAFYTGLIRVARFYVTIIRTAMDAGVNTQEFWEAVGLNLRERAEHHVGMAASVLNDEDVKELKRQLNALDVSSDGDATGRCAQDQPSATDRQSLAASKLASGDVDEAILLYQKIIAEKPDDADAHCGLAMALIQNDRPEEATPHLEETIRLQPESPAACGALGVHYLKTGKLDEALHLLKTAVRVEPNISSTHFFLGMGLLQKEDYSAAEAQFREVIRIDPDNADAHIRLIALLVKDDDLLSPSGASHQAIDRCVEAAHLLLDCQNRNVAIAGADLDVLCNGVAQGLTKAGLYLHHKKGASQKAIELYRLAIDLDSEFSESYYNLGDALHDLSTHASGAEKKKLLNEAAQIFRKLVDEVRPGYADAHNTLGMILQDSGDLDGAIDNYRKAVECDPNLERARGNLATALRKKDQDDTYFDPQMEELFFVNAVDGGTPEDVEEQLAKHPGWSSGSVMGRRFLSNAASRDGLDGLEVVQLLVASGADPNEQDDDGDDAIDSADICGNTEVSLFLKKASRISDASERKRFARGAAQETRERRKKEEAAQKQREEERTRALAAQQAEEQRRQKIMAGRRGHGQCVMCGKPLGFLGKLLGDRHGGCNDFRE